MSLTTPVTTSLSTAAQIFRPSCKFCMTSLGLPGQIWHAILGRVSAVGLPFSDDKRFHRWNLFRSTPFLASLGCVPLSFRWAHLQPGLLLSDKRFILKPISLDAILASLRVCVRLRWAHLPIGSSQPSVDSGSHGLARFTSAMLLVAAFWHPRLDGHKFLGDWPVANGDPQVHWCQHLPSGAQGMRYGLDAIFSGQEDIGNVHCRPTRATGQPTWKARSLQLSLAPSTAEARQRSTDNAVDDLTTVAFGFWKCFGNLLKQYPRTGRLLGPGIK